MIPKHKGCGWVVEFAGSNSILMLVKNVVFFQMSSTLIKATFCDF
jgi:hypothetical protein